VGRKQERLRPTRERIQRDRNVHRLRLKKLDKLPKDVLLEALQVRRQRSYLPKRNCTRCVVLRILGVSKFQAARNMPSKPEVEVE
jgi:hypothetical protein